MAWVDRKMITLLPNTDFQLFDSQTNVLSPQFRAGKIIEINDSVRPWLCKLLIYGRGLYILMSDREG